jgi:hypothetical protein
MGPQTPTKKIPQAIANPLAARALERIPAAPFDTFCASLPVRVLKLLSRRLGYLHDSEEAQKVVARWLKPAGPLGDLFSLGRIGMELICNIAPAAPEAVLERIKTELDGANALSSAA